MGEGCCYFFARNITGFLFYQSKVMQYSIALCKDFPIRIFMVLVRIRILLLLMKISNQTLMMSFQNFSLNPYSTNQALVNFQCFQLRQAVQLQKTLKEVLLRIYPYGQNRDYFIANSLLSHRWQSSCEIGLGTFGQALAVLKV